jgi:hypothetical protein
MTETAQSVRMLMLIFMLLSMLMFMFLEFRSCECRRSPRDRTNQFCSMIWNCWNARSIDVDVDIDVDGSI